MIVIPIAPNTVEIPVVQSNQIWRILCLILSCFLVSVGYLRAEFDSTYPIHLNGIITPDEFQQSIANINLAVSSRKPLLIFGAFIGIFLIGGFILFIVGGFTATTSFTSSFPIPVAVGFSSFALGVLGCACGCFIIHVNYSRRMQQAIANESIKYSKRSPTPCSWRLGARTTRTSRFNDEDTTTTYHVSTLVFMIQFNNSLDCFVCLL